jgi:hypothetical protein
MIPPGGGSLVTGRWLRWSRSKPTAMENEEEVIKRFYPSRQRPAVTACRDASFR